MDAWEDIMAPIQGLSRVDKKSVAAIIFLPTCHYKEKKNVCVCMNGTHPTVYVRVLSRLLLGHGFRGASPEW